jgi:mannose-6-phosphate isomerase-like protein (cupin superfamily)
VGELSPREVDRTDLGQGRTFVFVNGNRVDVKICEPGLTMVEGSHLPRTGPPLHIHDNIDEGFYVLEGSYSLLCGSETLELATGSSAFVPRGTPHRFEPGANGGRMLLLYSPGGFEGYFEERHLEESQQGGNLTREQLASLGEKHGMRLANPGRPHAGGSRR